MNPTDALRTVFVVCLLAIPACRPLGGVGAESDPLPDGFVDVTDVVPDIVTEMRYATPHNFVGASITGYLAPRCILTSQAAEALARAQKWLNVFGLGLKVFDCYRPQRAVDRFVAWAKDLDDSRMRAEFYPHVQKTDLFNEGYIAARSSHTRGSTVDVTLVALNGSGSPSELDMGTSFDFFSPESWPTNMQMTGDQRAHRMLLQVVMKQAGFTPYSQEWWHFTLEKEPFQDTYFDFPVE